MLHELTVRYASWELSCVALVDRHRGTHLVDLYPIDKASNADKRRLAIDISEDDTAPASGIAPLLASQMKTAAQSGLAPPYLPLADEDDVNLEDIF